MNKKEFEIINRYLEGEKVNKICGDLNINMSTLYKTLKKHGIPLRSEKK